MSAELRLAPQISIESLDSRSLRFVNSANLFGIRDRSAGARAGALGEAAKRIMDVLLASVLLVVAAPFLAAMAAVVAMGGGSPLFGHERVGRGGRRFRCWKIRTMHRDAEARLVGLLQVDPVCRRQWDADRKLAPDPRATRLGRFLRRTSLDELPQLWNVLVGEMSLVGPRPVTGEELVRYGASAGHYCAVRPGITGVWQLSRGRDTSYEERVAMDRRYVETRTLAQDALILLMTLRVPFAPTGH
jgi:exopolysaccharide production protein ExoY